MRAAVGMLVLLGWSIAWLGVFHKSGVLIGATPTEVKWLVGEGLIAGVGAMLLLMSMRED